MNPMIPLSWIRAWPFITLSDVKQYSMLSPILDAIVTTVVG